MHPFVYTAADKADKAIDLIKRDEQAAFLAGGTTILDLMKIHIMAPSQLIDINELPLRGITAGPQELRLGALERMSDVGSHPDVVKSYPAVSESLLLAASAQLRNMATIGGNIMQRSRCGYFRDLGFAACNKRTPGSGCAAFTGITRTHAILGGSEQCIATHASDLAVALAALDAVVHVRGPKEERTIPFTEFHTVPGATPHVETTLGHDELIMAVTVPRTAWAPHSTYLKLRDRTSYAFALVSAAVALDADPGGSVRVARIALGGVATKPWRAFVAEQSLTGKPATVASFEAAARLAVQGAKTRPDNAFKVELVQRAVVRALSTVAGLA